MVMGCVYSGHVLGNNNPSVALMSIGEEDMRGNEVTKEAFKLLKASGLNFRGNSEGHDPFEKPAEVVACDGFTGNVLTERVRRLRSKMPAALQPSPLGRR
jgi:phosphate acyltransferase